MASGSNAYAGINKARKAGLVSASNAKKRKPKMSKMSEKPSDVPF